MKMPNAIKHVVILFSLLFTGCALNPTTEVRKLDASFSAKAARAPVAIIQFDMHMIQAPEADQVVAQQFGLIGALIWAAAKDAEIKRDQTVDEEGVRLYREARSLLGKKLSETSAIRFIELDPAPERDDVELSQRIRHTRFHGSEAPTADEIKSFCERHNIAYALYSKHWGGLRELDGMLFMNSAWNIYDETGGEAASIFTRSKSEGPASKTDDAEDRRAEILRLYIENLEKFVATLDGAGP